MLFSSEVLQLICIDLRLVPEVVIIDVHSIVGLLEVLSVHLVAHLSKGLPLGEPSRQVRHLVVYADKGVVVSGHLLRVFRKPTIRELASKGHSSVVVRPDLISVLHGSGQVIRQRYAFLKDLRLGST